MIAANENYIGAEHRPESAESERPDALLTFLLQFLKPLAIRVELEILDERLQGTSTSLGRRRIMIADVLFDLEVPVSETAVNNS